MKILIALLITLVVSATVSAQTAAFSYQGRLAVNGTPASATYNMQFALFDAAVGGAQVGTTVTNSAVQVTNGIFTVQLDFGVGSFPGADRFLDVRVFDTATSAYVNLTPRQPITSAPYAVRSLKADVADNAINLNGVSANQYVLTTDPRLTDERAASSINFGTATLTGVLPIAHGGTGSSTQSFVDLLTNQTIGGTKTFSSTIGGSAANEGINTGNSATPSVANLTLLALNYSVTTALTDLTGGVNGQCVVLVALNDKVTIADAGNFRLSKNWIPFGDDTLTVCLSSASGGPLWYERARSQAPNSPPVISDIANQTINANSSMGPIVFNVGDLETAGANLTLSKTSSNTTLVPNANIVFGGSGGNRTVTITPAPNQGGSTTITLTVTDPQGLTASDTFILTVIPPNGPPTMTSVNLTPGTAFETSTLTCTPTATDPDGDTVTFTFAWIKNGTTLGATTSTLTGASFSKGDSVSCRVTPNDGTVNGTPMTSNVVTISNTPPSITSATISPSVAYTTTTLTCIPAGAADADGDVVTFLYSWTVNGTTVAGQTSSTLTGTSFDKGQNVACRVTPFDGTASGTQRTSNVITISNSAPTMTNATLTPSPAFETSTMTCTPAAIDADGDTVTFTFAWTVNGSTVAGQTSSTLTSSFFTAGVTVACRVTPFDGTVSGTPLTSNGVTISSSLTSTIGGTLKGLWAGSQE